jgi:hypothetical protein
MRALDGIKDPRAPLQLESLFADAGFVEVESRMIPLPLCEWSTGKGLPFISGGALFERSKWISFQRCSLRGLMGWINLDPRQRRIGNANREITSTMLSTLAVYPFTRQLGMTNQEYGILVAQARADAANHNLRPYFPV